MRKIRADPHYEGYVELMSPNDVGWDVYIDDNGRLVLDYENHVDPPTPLELCEMWRLWRELHPDRTPTG